MNITDKEMDEALQKLASLAPCEPVWQDIKDEITDQQVDGRHSGFNKGLFTGAGLAAVIMVSAIIVFYSLTNQKLVQPDIEFAQNREVLVGQLSEAEQVMHFAQQQTGRRRGKYARHLYAGDEALWDAMLENEIGLLDQAMLYSPPREQRKLWGYRNKLTEQLVALRGQPKAGKYLF